MSNPTITGIGGGRPLLGLQHAGSQNELMQQYDTERQQDRAFQDAQGPQPGTNVAQQNYFNAFNRGREDAATGPQGFNRQWVPLLESLKGSHLTSAPGLPTETYSDPTHSGQMTLQGQSGHGIASDPNSTFNTTGGPFGAFGAAALQGLNRYTR